MRLGRDTAPLCEPLGSNPKAKDGELIGKPRKARLRKKLLYSPLQAATKVGCSRADFEHLAKELHVLIIDAGPSLFYQVTDVEAVRELWIRRQPASRYESISDESANGNTRTVTSTRPKNFYSAISGARALHVSTRQFRRLAEDCGVEPFQIGRHNFFWRPTDIELIREYHDSIKRQRA